MREQAITASAVRLSTNQEWQDAERTHEMNRLRRILMHAQLTPMERKVAREMMSFWEQES